jgi:hypothetical protein
MLLFIKIIHKLNRDALLITKLNPNLEPIIRAFSHQLGVFSASINSMTYSILSLSLISRSRSILIPYLSYFPFFCPCQGPGLGRFSCMCNSKKLSTFLISLIPPNFFVILHCRANRMKQRVCLFSYETLQNNARHYSLFLFSFFFYIFQ